MAYFSIGIGGIIGSLLRYFVSLWSGNLLGNSFPFGTLIANIAGAFLLGIFTRKVAESNRANPNYVLAIGTGAIGSFTTLSTLSTETVLLIEKSEWLLAFIYIILSLIGGLGAAWIGYRQRGLKGMGVK